MREKLIELIKQARRNAWGKSLSDIGSEEEFIAGYLLANGVTVETEKKKTETNLTNKCGGCAYSEQARDVFGGSKCYVRCTNKEHFHSKRFAEHPLTAVRQRTAKACKKYVPKTEDV